MDLFANVSVPMSTDTSGDARKKRGVSVSTTLGKDKEDDVTPIAKFLLQMGALVVVFKVKNDSSYVLEMVASTKSYSEAVKKMKDSQGLSAERIRSAAYSCVQRIDEGAYLAAGRRIEGGSGDQCTQNAVERYQRIRANLQVGEDVRSRVSQSASLLSSVSMHGRSDRGEFFRSAESFGAANVHVSGSNAEARWDGCRDGVASSSRRVGEKSAADYGQRRRVDDIDVDVQGQGRASDCDGLSGALQSSSDDVGMSVIDSDSLLSRLPERYRPYGKAFLEADIGALRKQCVLRGISANSSRTHIIERLLSSTQRSAH